MTSIFLCFIDGAFLTSCLVYAEDNDSSIKNFRSALLINDKKKVFRSIQKLEWFEP